MASSKQCRRLTRQRVLQVPRIIIEHINRPIMMPAGRHAPVRAQVHTQPKAPLAVAARLVRLYQALGRDVPHVHLAVVCRGRQVVLVRAQGHGPDVARALALRVGGRDLVVEGEVARVRVAAPYLDVAAETDGHCYVAAAAARGGCYVVAAKLVGV